MPRGNPSDELTKSLADISLPDADGKPFLLGSAWKSQNVVLVHLRHFGCLYCRQQVGNLKEKWPEFQKLNTSVVCIGTGDVAYANRFVKEFQVPFPVLSDDKMVSYAAVQAKEMSLFYWVAPSNLQTMVNVMRMGYVQGKAGNNQRFLGATHVFLKGGTVAYSWLNDGFSNEAPLNEVLDIVDVL